ncbi:Fe-S cluster assembly protein SufD [Janibacter cremeus]|uniref:Fe-S cluster assembly protein SufD n=1 Tax=Janibacter cremeus TaxID=1285192 RepID=A0A852VRL3_9MICO|nr:Fe-S cluster assembly protein SufD [Janibacter cremeus]NYF99647.1 Fe-S cluster assembly protein SufD [Janibacter cremeus]
MSLLADTSSRQAHTHSGETMVPDASRGERTRSWEVAEFPMPQGREEDWRFTPISRLTNLLADEASGATLEWTTHLPEGVTLTTTSVEELGRDALPKPIDRPAALAAAHGGGISLVDVPKEHELTEPVRISLDGTERQIVNGHLVVRVGAFSSATIVLSHTGSSDYNELVTVIAGDSSKVTLVTLQDWQDDTHHLAQHDVVVGRDASARHIAISIGGGIVRLNTNASYTGPGGSFEGLGVYFADAGQHLEHRLFVDHEAPHCRSNVEYKGALQGETAQTVWVGDVLIRAAAEGTDTYELNRNLILTDGARADSVPNLEIETGEIVGAGHASTTGRFDDQQLFYLQSRGIPQELARRLVVRGFFNSIVQRIGDEEISEKVMAAIDEELEASSGAMA